VWCTGISITGLNPGELPRVSLTFAVAYWDEINVTFPSATATSASTAKPTAAGSFFLNAVGTATRQTYCPRAFALNISINAPALTGNCGNYDRQNIVGARRIGSKAMIDVVFDSEAVGTQTWADQWDTDESTLNYQHGLYTINSDLAVYFPKLKIMGERPTQEDVDGLNRVRVQYEALTGGTTTSALTLSSWRLAMA
jgi:hypothetical protein